MPDICLLYCFVSVNESTFAYMRKVFLFPFKSSLFSFRIQNLKLNDVIKCLNMKQENVLLKHLGIKPSLRMNLVSLCHPAKIYLKVVQQVRSWKLVPDPFLFIRIKHDLYWNFFKQTDYVESLQQNDQNMSSSTCRFPQIPSYRRFLKNIRRPGHISSKNF